MKDGNNLAVKQSALYQIYLWECNKKSIKETEQITTISAKLEEDRNKHKGLEEEIQALESAHQTRVKDYEVNHLFHLAITLCVELSSIIILAN